MPTRSSRSASSTRSSSNLNRRRVRSTSRPNEPNYVLRRIVVLGSLALILVLLVWGVIATIRWLFGESTEDSTVQSAQSAQSLPQQVSGHLIPPDGEATPDGILEADGTITVPPCFPSDVTISLEPQTVGVGAGVKLPLVVKNTGPMACLFAADQLHTVVTSGEDVYFNSGACNDKGDSTPLLLSPSRQWTGSTSWNGRVYQECTPIDSDGDGQANVADAGTYTVRVSIGNTDAGASTVLIVE